MVLLACLFVLTDRDPGDLVALFGTGIKNRATFVALSKKKMLRFTTLTLLLRSSSIIK